MHRSDEKYFFLQKSQCQSGGIHPPSKESMKEFVKVARRRMKYISVCGENFFKNLYKIEIFQKKFKKQFKTISKIFINFQVAQQLVGECLRILQQRYQI